MEKIRVDKLQLGDCIRLSEIGSKYMDCTVFKIDILEKEVSCWRPYITVADFACGNMVIPYIGLETVNLYRDDTREVILISKGPKLE